MAGAQAAGDTEKQAANVQGGRMNSDIDWVYCARVVALVGLLAFLVMSLTGCAAYVE
jgi:hypothetical protein